MMTRLIPKIFYHSMKDGLDLFVNGLGFKLLYQDKTLAVIEREGAKAYLVLTEKVTIFLGLRRGLM